jgi:hypothetical protein
MRLPGQCCGVCGAEDIIAVTPGQGAVYAAARDRLGQPDERLGSVLLRRPIPGLAWCEPHWIERFGIVAAVA